MTVVTARRYRAGKPVEDFVLDGEPRHTLAVGTFDWIGLTDPTARELELARLQFGLHPLAIEDALTANQPPKLEPYGEQLFIIVRTAEIHEGERIDFGQTSLFVARDFIVSVRLGSARSHSSLRAKLEHKPDHLGHGPDFVAHAILDFIVDGYFPILDRFEEAVHQMEERAVDRFPEPSAIRRMFRLRRQLRRFVATVEPMVEVCHKLVVERLPAIDQETHFWFRDVFDHVRRAVARARSLNETLATIVEMASLLEQHRQGDMTRKLASWAAILAVPTAIAGVYGMNFRYMPELEWHYGYFAILGVIAAVCTGLWLRFKTIGWL